LLHAADTGDLPAMMKFDCPHCGQQLIHQEDVAGREGWCRFCKCILVMPHPGQPAVRSVLTLQQQFAQLERMFRFAAGIVDEHRQLQSSLANGQQGLAHAIQSRADAERSAEALREEMGRKKTTQAQLETECHRLAGQLDQTMSERAAYQSASEVRMAQVKLELKAQEDRDGLMLSRVKLIEEELNRAEQGAKESFDERDSLLRSIDALRTKLAQAQATEAALNVRVAQADDRERALETELQESKRTAAESRSLLEAQCKQLTDLYTEEHGKRTDAETRKDDAQRLAECIPILEDELADTRTALEAAEERNDSLAEQCSTLDKTLKETQQPRDLSQEGLDLEQQRLSEENAHYRDVLQKVEQDLAEIEAKRQANEASLKKQIDEKEVELWRETSLRVQAELSTETSKKQLAAAEENLKLLRESTESLRSEIGMVTRAKAV
jgi:hypothetical protein